MATQKSVPRSKNQSAHLSRKTRVAHAAGEEILAHLRDDPVLRVLAEQQTLKDDVAALKQAVGVLATAPQQRIGAARRLQGAASRRQTAAQQLFAACGEIRRRVKIRFRGPRHQELRQGFGEGLAANASKPETVLSFADQILQSAAQHPDALREVRVLPSTIRRVGALREALSSGRPESATLREERRRVAVELNRAAEEVAARGRELLRAAEAEGLDAERCDALRALVQQVGQAGSRARRK